MHKMFAHIIIGAYRLLFYHGPWQLKFQKFDFKIQYGDTDDDVEWIFSLGPASLVKLI